MNGFVLFAAILTILCAGCFEPPHDNGVDVKISAFTLENDTPFILGSDIPISVKTMSDRPEVEYLLVIKFNGEKVFDEIRSGNVSEVIHIPAVQDGEVNISAQVFLQDGKRYFDTNYSNDMEKKTINILPYGHYSNIQFTNSTNIHDTRRYATKLSFEHDVEIYSVGLMMRKVGVLSPNATFYMFIREDINGTPSNNSVLNFSTNLARLFEKWSILILQSAPKRIAAGNYWLDLYIDGEGYAEVACSESIAGENQVGLVFSEKTKWKEAGSNCTPYLIISSRNPLETYKEYRRANNIST